MEISPPSDRRTQLSCVDELDSLQLFIEAENMCRLESALSLPNIVELIHAILSWIVTKSHAS